MLVLSLRALALITNSAIIRPVNFDYLGFLMSKLHSISQPDSILGTDMNQLFTPEVIRGLQGFLSIVNNGINLKDGYAMSPALAQQGLYAAEVKYLKSNPEIAQLFEERYLAPNPDLDKLAKLPKDSLGFAYASYLLSNNYVQDFYPPMEVVDDESYYYMRIQQTHDIWHTVNGWLDSIGGIKLAAFQLAQTRSSLLTLAITSTTLNAIKMNQDINPMVAFLQEGYNVGLKAKPFLAQKWEEAWEKPLAEWRAELNITHVGNVRTEEASLAAV
ncbi:MAG: Coq4 family protein [Sphaerospermopsis kisseleviana]